MNAGALPHQQPTGTTSTPLHVSNATHNSQGQFYSPTTPTGVADLNSSDTMAQTIGKMWISACWIYIMCCRFRW